MGMGLDTRTVCDRAHNGEGGNMNAGAEKARTLLLVLGALFAIWGILGWMDVGNLAQGGYATDGNNTVTQVLPGSPSEKAGLQVGDYIVSMNGISTEDAAAFSRQSRPDVGETWPWVVTRDGETVNFDLTWGELVPQRKLIAHGSVVVGFCLLGFTLWAHWKRPSRATAALAMAGVFLSLAFLNGPYFESSGLRSFSNALAVIIVFVGVASLLYFLMVYPKVSSFLDKANGKLIFFAPAVALGLFLAYRTLMTPVATSGLNVFTNIFAGVVISIYVLGSVVYMVRSYLGASAEERDNKGLNLMLIGTLVGLLPIGLATLINVFAPQVVLPGQPFYFLALILIPITWSVAVMRGSG